MIADRIVDGYHDPDPFRTPREKLADAYWAYIKTNGFPPEYVRVSAWTAEQIAGCGLEIRVDPWLQRDSFYLGVES